MASKQAVVTAYQHFTEDKEAAIDFDDLTIDIAIRAATQDEIDNDEIVDYPTGYKR